MQESLIYPIKQNLSQKLKDREYRHTFFRIRCQDDIAGRIRELRNLRRFTQKELSEKCEMRHQSTISRIEQASYSSWSIKTLWRLAEALDVRMKIIFEPWEDVVKQYEELEKQEYAQLAISAVFEGQRERVPPPPDLVKEAPQGANNEAQYPVVPQRFTGKPILDEPQPIGAR